jgi:hypothetical protein
VATLFAVLNSMVCLLSVFHLEYHVVEGNISLEKRVKIKLRRCTVSKEIS